MRTRLQNPGQLQAPNDDPDLKRQVIFPTRKMTASPRASLALSINPENILAQTGLSLLDRLATRPPGAPAQLLVARGMQQCLRAALEVLGATDSRPAAMQETIGALVTELEAQMDDTSQAESLQAARGLKSKYPGWSALCAAGAADHVLAHTFLGLKVLKALHEEQPLGPAASSRFHALLVGPDLNREQVHSLLTDSPCTEEEDHGAVADLRRTYRQVLRAYLVDTTPPPTSGRSRVTGQLLDGVLAATAARRAGASTHRELSPGQMSLALAHIEQGLTNDTLNGCLGVLVAISGFTPDLLLATPLAGPARPDAADLYLDLEKGMLSIDHSGLVREAATAQPGCMPASLICAKPLPVQLQQNLLKRRAQRPDATSLADLYPGVPCPASDEPVYPSPDMICPSWARFRNSLGAYLRNQSLDSLMASVISGRFWHIPKSKLYYMTLPRGELQTGFDRFYKLAGWGCAVALQGGLAFGSAVVPSIEAIKAHDLVLQQACADLQPGKHAGLARLIEHHNRFMRLVGFRLSCMLALRESAGIDLTASVDEREHRWVAVYDKDVLHPLPMPISAFARETFRAVRAHCRALRGRLIALDEGKSALARWCQAVSNHEAVPLLQQARSTSEPFALPTRTFLQPHDDTPRLPPDFGRKLMENELRRQGLRSGEVDALLRHDVEGQSMLSSTAHHQRQATWVRTTQAVDRVAALCFGAVVYGLAKE